MLDLRVLFWKVPWWLLIEFRKLTASVISTLSWTTRFWKSWSFIERPFVKELPLITLLPLIKHLKENKTTFTFILNTEVFIQRVEPCIKRLQEIWKPTVEKYLRNLNLEWYQLNPPFVILKLRRSAFSNFLHIFSLTHNMA